MVEFEFSGSSFCLISLGSFLYYVSLGSAVSRLLLALFRLFFLSKKRRILGVPFSLIVVVDILGAVLLIVEQLRAVKTFPDEDFWCDMDDGRGCAGSFGLWLHKKKVKIFNARGNAACLLPQASRPRA